MSAGERLITIATYREPIEGALLQSRLEDEGIESYLIDGNMSATAWYLADAVGGAKVQVKSSDASRALEVLKSIHDSEPSVDRDESPPPTPCVALIERAIKAGLFGLLFFPLQLYSLWLLFRAARCRQDEPFVKKCLLIFLINSPTIVTLFVVLAYYIRAFVDLGSGPIIDFSGTFELNPLYEGSE